MHFNMGKHPASASFWEPPQRFGPAMPFITLAVALIGTGISAYGQVQQAGAQADQINAQNKTNEAQSRYQAAVANNNKIYAERAAQDAIAKGNVEASQKAAATRQLAGRQRAALAANGLDVSQGTPLDIAADTAAAGTTDILTIHANADRQALAYRQQGANFQGEAGLYNAYAQNSQGAVDPNYLGAAATALGGAGTVAQKWYDYSQQASGSQFGNYSQGYSAGANVGNLFP